MILFLDFDGVLHPRDVFVEDGQPVLHCGETRLFEYVPVLELALADREDVQIVLSTSWVPVFGYHYSVDRLSPTLQSRVIGATWDARPDGCSEPQWQRDLSRYQQIEQYLRRFNVEDWVAIDDDRFGWPENLEGHLVYCIDDYFGIAHKKTFARLQSALVERQGSEP